MTDADLHRREWLLERAGLLMSDGWPQLLADHRAAELWLDWQNREQPKLPRPDPQEAPAKC